MNFYTSTNQEKAETTAWYKQIVLHTKENYQKKKRKLYKYKELTSVRWYNISNVCMLIYL